MSVEYHSDNIIVKFDVFVNLIMYHHHNVSSQQSLFQVVSIERRLNGSASRTMAAMSLGYIVMVTPWAIQEIVAACTNSKVSLRNGFRFCNSSYLLLRFPHF